VTDSTKIAFRYRRVSQVSDVTDLVTMLFPDNRNQQHAAARILLVLRDAEDLRDTLSDLQRCCGISRRTLERTRAKLARLGLIERVSWMNTRYGGREGWKLSSRMSSSLRQLADRIDAWRGDRRPECTRKEQALIELLRPACEAAEESLQVRRCDE
jgi:DNA-binding HxlR family transcriptional regulator